MPADHLLSSPAGRLRRTRPRRPPAQAGPAQPRPGRVPIFVATRDDTVVGY